MEKKRMELRRRKKMLLEQFSNLGEKEEKHCSTSSGCSKSTYPEVLLKMSQR